MTDNSNDTKSSVINLGQITANEVSINTDTGVIVITEDKLKLALLERKAMLVGRDSWIAPLGIFISILLTILTTDFHKFLLTAPVWEAIFYIALLLDAGWLIYALKTRPKDKSIAEFIQQIKKKEKSNEI
jgi:hypothetical protein